MAPGINSISIIDYIVFAAVLLISLAIGIFYSFRQETTSEYVHGSHQMKLIPVSLSMVVSFISAITVQGLPAEIYMYGLEVCFSLTGIVGVLLINFTFLPIYYELKPTTVFDYLELRYKSKYPKLLGSYLGMLTMLLYSGLIMFGPAAALESLIGIPTGYNIIAMAGICTIYTSIGGIKAVIWTDAFQAVVMVLGIIIVIIIGMLNIDTHDILNELRKHGRTSLNLNPSLFQRNSVWIFTFIKIIHYATVFSKQSAMVRYTSLPTITQAKLSTVIGAIGFLILQGLSMLMGVIVFVYYSQHGCGPMASGTAYSPNQIIPIFLMEVGNYPGVPGLFVAAVVASTLSSASSAQNSVGTILWKMFFMNVNFMKNISERKKVVLLKLITLILGLVSTGIAFIAMYAGGTLFQASAAVLGVIGTPPFGMFLLGACCTFVSSTAALTGCILMTTFCACVSLGKLLYGTLWMDPTLIDDSCVASFNTTYTNATVLLQENSNEIESAKNYFLLKLFSISSYAYPLFGIGGTFVIGLILSLFPCMRNKEHVDERLIFPFLRKFIKQKGYQKKNMNIAEQLQEEKGVLLSPIFKNHDFEEENNVMISPIFKNYELHKEKGVSLSPILQKRKLQEENGLK